MIAFETLSKSLKPHLSLAQILIQVNDEGLTLSKALTLLESVGIKNVDYHAVHKKNPQCFIIYLPSEYIKDASIKLVESGFTKIKGVNPSHTGF